MTATPPADALQGPLRAMRAPVMAGAAVLAVFFGFLVVWSLTVPFAGGVIAPGLVSPEGSRRTVQHLEGGIIEAILVADGDAVMEGDTLIRLQGAQARANYEVLLGQQRLLEAQLARLTSEQAGADAPRYPEHLVGLVASDPEVAELLQGQTDLFRQRQELYRNQIAIMERRVAQLEAEIAGLQAQIVSQDVRLGLVGTEVESMQALFAEGLVTRPRLLALQREQASIEEQKAGNSAAISRARQAIGETEVQLLAINSERLDEVTMELSRVRAELTETNERLLASQDVLDRTTVQAPIGGVVVNLRYRTVGGVIAPGQPILDIVPQNEALIVEARVSPSDIDAVSREQSVIVRFPALPQGNLPQIEGRVVDVSADALFDQAANASYFLVRISVDQETIDALADARGEPIVLTPGMPAEALIVSERRTIFDYIIAPLTRSFQRAMRET